MLVVEVHHKTVEEVLHKIVADVVVVVHSASRSLVEHPDTPDLHQDNFQVELRDTLAVLLPDKLGSFVGESSQVDNQAFEPVGRILGSSVGFGS